MRRRVAAATDGVRTCRRGRAGAEPVKIGVILSLSGPAAVFGLPERNAIMAIQKEIDAAGGVKGKKLELVFFDDKTNPTEAARGVTQLINDDKVVAIIGPGTGGTILAAGPIAERLKVPLFGPAGTVAITAKTNSLLPGCSAWRSTTRSASRPYWRVP